MNIAVASEGLEVASYFERSSNFNYFIIENGEIKDYRNIPSLAFQNGPTAATLRDLGIDTIIAGCIGEKARTSLEKNGITVFHGAMGDAKQAVEAYITDTFIACDESCDEYHDLIDEECFAEQ